jgi:hypothetical protein
MKDAITVKLSSTPVDRLQSRSGHLGATLRNYDRGRMTPAFRIHPGSVTL